jgi:hypothetical protein
MIRHADASNDGACRPQGAAMKHNGNDPTKQHAGLVTEGWKHVTGLRRKLPWLYGAHPYVKKQGDLARWLGVSEATLATWLNGADYKGDIYNADCIKIDYYQKFLGIWSLPSAIVEIEDVEEFRRTLETYEAGRGPWEKLVHALPEDSNIQIILNEARGTIQVPDDHGEAGNLHFHELDEFQIVAPSHGLRHAVMLLQDRRGWETLHPTGSQPDTQVGDILVWPRQSPTSPPRFRQFDDVGGIHRLVVLLSDERLPVDVLGILLGQPLAESSLNAVTFRINNLLVAGKCRLVSRKFLVIAAPRTTCRICHPATRAPAGHEAQAAAATGTKNKTKAHSALRAKKSPAAKKHTPSTPRRSGKR